MCFVLQCMDVRRYRWMVKIQTYTLSPSLSSSSTNIRVIPEHPLSLTHYHLISILKKRKFERFTNNSEWLCKMGYIESLKLC